MHNLFGVDGRGRTTGTANSTLYQLIPPSGTGVTKLLQLQAINGANNSQGITAMLCIGRTVLSEAAAASQPRLKLKANPGPSTNQLAANDIIVVRDDNGAVYRYTVSNGSYADCNLTSNLTTALSAGSTVWNFGVTTDTDPATGQAHQVYNMTALATLNLPPSGDAAVALASGHSFDEPIVLSCNNTNTAGANSSSYEFISFGYDKRG